MEPSKRARTRADLSKSARFAENFWCTEEKIMRARTCEILQFCELAKNFQNARAKWREMRERAGPLIHKVPGLAKCAEMTKVLAEKIFPKIFFSAKQKIREIFLRNSQKIFQCARGKNF